MTTPSENPADAIENIAADAQPSKAAALPVQFVGDEPEPAGAMTDAESRAAWAQFAKGFHGWPDGSVPPMVDGKFEAGWQELEYQIFRAGVDAGLRSAPVCVSQNGESDPQPALTRTDDPQADRVGLARAIADVMTERIRQMAAWGNKHDDEHGHDTLANGAVDFLLPGQSPIEGCSWAFKSKTTDRDPRRLQMVKGAALALAAIEAYDRAEPVGTPGVECPDGGKCHHSCTAVCWRKDSGCVPLSISGLDDNWRRPKAPTGGSGS